ncbi:hypothetical protein WBP06_13435 [Novosphingobium sp. BL-8H]|uniref:hypothetical protein n=1 Tax=Novosphingobium sp. BL-8H TaxID=3127640 RepID=UPI0037584A63
MFACSGMLAGPVGASAQVAELASGDLPGSTDSVGTPDAAALPADAAAMTGAYFMRDSLVPRADDVALIQRKPALYLSSFNDGMATVAYSLEGRRIVYRVVSGTVNAAARDAIDRALAKLQRKVA